MCKKWILLVVFALATAGAFSQSEKPKIYNPQADAASDIRIAVEKANSQKKHVLIQVGGNWCPWCIKLHGFFESDTRIDSLIKSDYIFILVNHSKENKNLPVLASLEFPQRFGFPVLLVLDGSGKLLHIQDTGLLEDGKGGYAEDKVVGFLSKWNFQSLDPALYVEKPMK
jgi:thioredoxin-related protein